MRTAPFADKGLHYCDCCEKDWDANELSDIQSLHRRVEAGGIIPSGECPECGSLSYPHRFNEVEEPLV
jgi:hypothetical protein